MAAHTPMRRLAAGGYYADPASPIASTPQRGKGKAPPATPTLATLSPMKTPTDRALQRHVPPAPAAVAPEETKGWTGIFSPVLKFFDDGSSAAAETGPAVPTLAAAPPPRKGATATTVHSHSSSHTAAGSSPGVRATATVSTSSVAVSGVTGSALAQRAAVSLSLYTSSAEDMAPDAGVTTHTPGAGYATGGAAAMPTAAAYPPVAPGSPTATYVRTAPAPAPAPAPAAEPEAEEDYEYEYEEFNPYLFIKMLPPYASVAPRVPRIVLPKKVKKTPEISLVLDLDETLVHCSVDPIPDADVQFPVAFNGVNYQVYVRKRPYLDKFLQWAASRFEVVIFTASQQVYAEKLLSIIDPESKLIQHRLYRDSCLNVDGNYLKDLNVLGRDLSKTVLVDNSPHAFGYQIDNGIPIESWFDDRSDTELLKLTKFLETLLGQPDVRLLLREKFRVFKLVSDAR